LAGAQPKEIPLPKDLKIQRLDKRLTDSITDELLLDLLRILSERSATPRELAEILGEDASDVLDRLVELWAESCIEVVEEVEPHGEAMDRRYRIATPIFVDDREAEELSSTTREEITISVLQSIFTETLVALRTGSFEARADRHLSWKALRLDEEGWRQLMALLLRTLKEAEAIEESARERLATVGEAGFEAVVTLMGFERSESRAA